MVAASQPRSRQASRVRVKKSRPSRQSFPSSSGHLFNICLWSDTIKKACDAFIKTHLPTKLSRSTKRLKYYSLQSWILHELQKPCEQHVPLEYWQNEVFQSLVFIWNTIQLHCARMKLASPRQTRPNKFPSLMLAWIPLQTVRDAWCFLVKVSPRH